MQILCTVVALAGSGVSLAAPAAAKEIKFPDLHPVVSMQVPDDWTVTITEAGMEAIAPETNSFLFAKVLTRPKDDPNRWVAQSLASLRAHGVVFGGPKTPPPASVATKTLVPPPALPPVSLDPNIALAPQPSPSEAKSAETKPAETKPAETKAAEPKAAEPKAAETKAAEAGSAAHQAVSLRPTESASVEAKPVDAKPVEPKPVDAKPVEPKPVDAKPVEPKPVDAKPLDAKPVEEKSVEAKPVDAKPLETKPAEAGTVAVKAPDAAAPDAKPVDAKPVDAKPVDAHDSENKSVVGKPPEAKPADQAIALAPAKIPVAIVFPRRIFPYRNTAVDGKPVAVELLTYKLPSKSLLFVLQESGPTDDRVVAIINSIKAAD